MTQKSAVHSTYVFGVLQLPGDSLLFRGSGSAGFVPLLLRRSGELSVVALVFPCFLREAVLFSSRLFLHEGVTAFVYVDMWILFYVLIPSILGFCGLFSCVFDRPKISFVSHDMCCISREFIFIFLCIYYIRYIWFLVNFLSGLFIFCYNSLVLVCKYLRLRALYLVVSVLIRICIAAGFENNFNFVLAFLHLPLDVKVANFSGCILFFSLSFHMFAVVSVSVLILLFNF